MVDQDILRTSLLNNSREVFGTMLGMEVEEDASQPEPELPGKPRVAALIGFTGAYVGNGTISCTPQLACAIASTMMMAEYETVDGEVVDALGEMSNMIFGNVKNDLEEHLGPLQLGIPSVIVGQRFDIHSTQKPASVKIALLTGAHRCDIQLCVYPAA
jgi:chemotaxis protein CheX